jgi:hypothetical protein
MPCCRLSADEMRAVTDADLIEQCHRALAPDSGAAANSTDADMTAQGQQAADVRHKMPSPLAAPVAEATLPIPEEEYSPRTRRFVSMQRAAHPAGRRSAGRQQLEAWRAGYVDVSPASEPAHKQLIPASADDAPAANVPHAQAVTSAADAPRRAAASKSQPAAGVPAPLPPAEIDAGAATAATPRRTTLLQALLRGHL